MGLFFGWLLLSFIVAFIGRDRRIGYGGTLLLSLLLSPIIGALFAIASKRKTEEKKFQAPSDVYKFNNIAEKEFRKGNYQNALSNLLEAQKLSSNKKIVLFNLAVCYSVTRNKRKAFYYLDKSIENGYSNFRNIQETTSLEYLRQQPEFNDFVLNGYRLPFNQNISNTTVDSISQLEKLAHLKENGILTEEEFQKEKQKVLNSSNISTSG